MVLGRSRKLDSLAGLRRIYILFIIRKIIIASSLSGTTTNCGSFKVVEVGSIL